MGVKKNRLRGIPYDVHGEHFQEGGKEVKKYPEYLITLYSYVRMIDIPRESVKSKKGPEISFLEIIDEWRWTFPEISYLINPQGGCGVLGFSRNLLFNTENIKKSTGAAKYFFSSSPLPVHTYDCLVQSLCYTF